MFLVHSDFFDEIVDDLLLIPVDLACCKEDDKSEIVLHGLEYTKISGTVPVNARALTSESCPTWLLHSGQANAFVESTYEDPAKF